MKPCPAVLDLGYPTVATCEHAAGHPGPHYSEAWNPDGIAWYGAAA